MDAGGATLERRLANFRAGLAAHARPDEPVRRPGGAVSADLAERLAAATNGEVVTTRNGTYVRREPPTLDLPIDRTRLARLPGQPPADAPLLCLDTETTGLATAAGTLAFLVGLGWWDGNSFRQRQLLLPDHPDEPALLEELAGHLPREAWLVTYNGRSFDWPLIVARFRLARQGPPPLSGHLDLLPLVRRVFRHRMTNARLQTVEASVLGRPRHDEVGGWEIPTRYLDFVRGGSAAALVEVVEHNEEDVRSLARLLVHVERGYADRAVRRAAPRGDLAGLARAYARAGDLEVALECLDDALEAVDAVEANAPRGAMPNGPARAPEPWWSPRRRPDFGGRGRGRLPVADPRLEELADPWTTERIGRERAHVLRRLGRYEEAAEAFAEIAFGGGVPGILAWIEVAKLREHRLRDPAGAFAAVRAAWRLAERRRALGMAVPRLEADLLRRGRRLRARLTSRRSRVRGRGAVPEAALAAALEGTPMRD
jgi:tetratricopeptide (TPR) repeat protein